MFLLALPSLLTPRIIIMGGLGRERKCEGEESAEQEHWKVGRTAGPSLGKGAEFIIPPQASGEKCC